MNLIVSRRALQARSHAASSVHMVVSQDHAMVHTLLQGTEGCEAHISMILLSERRLRVKRLVLLVQLDQFQHCKLKQEGLHFKMNT